MNPKLDTALTQWALDNGSDDLRYAVREGYPVGDAVYREYAESLCPEVTGAQRISKTSVGAVSDRTMPSERARSLLSGVHSAVRVTGLLPGVSVEISRILRVSYLHEPRTAVVVSVRFGDEKTITIAYLLKEVPLD